MILIITALMIEAQPLRTVLKLDAVNGEPFPVFQKDDLILVVSGTGSQRAAAATGWALGKYPGITAALNLGFAGASEETADLYQWCCVHSIRDESSGRLHVPDRLWKLPFSDYKLLTAGKPVSGESSWDGLVDMEGSGFYEAARQVLPTDRILLLKWVSDHLSEVIDKQKVSANYSQSIKEVEPVVRDMIQACSVEESPDPTILKEINSRIRLTQTQKQYLRKWVDGYLKRGGSEKDILAILPMEQPAKKAENNRKFEGLKNVLKG